MARARTSSPDRRWRPASRRGPVCGYTFREASCQRRGSHHCHPRADRVVAFFAELLVHTAGPYQRQAFVPRPWESDDILSPLFGEVVWSAEWDRYVRRYRIAYIVLARKNGKSALMAGVVLYLLVGDDEEASEVYGAAKDTKQAGKVFQPVNRMRQLSAVLSKRLGWNKSGRRIYDEQTGSYYEVITADALGELGHNPHGFVLDEVLSQPDGSLWDTMVTSQGTRAQPLYLAITTETNDPVSFGAELIDEAERIEEDPQRAPHVFAYVRKLPSDQKGLERLRRLHPGHPDLPVSTDPWDEANWRWSNPALDDFKSRTALREAAIEAHNEPRKQNSFRQFQLNQRVQQVTRHISLDTWDRNAFEICPSPAWLASKLKGKCWGGLDLSAKLDLTAWTLLFPDGWVWWRFWAPESVVPALNEATGGQFEQWVRQGWVTLTDGSTIDYEQVYADIGADVKHAGWTVVDVTYDKWSGEPVRQQLEDRYGLKTWESDTTYTRMTAPMIELERLLAADELKHGGNPVARWMADALQAKRPTDDPDRIRPVKPDRQRTRKRVDGMITLLMAIDGRMRGAPAVKRKVRVSGY